MKKNRILSALLCLSLAAGLVIPGLPAYAEGEGESSNSGMKLNKTAVANGDDTYTITLEAYATGEKVISQVNKDVPTDIVLVLDQSGSMDDPIGEAKFNAYSYNQSKNSQHYERRHNGGSANLWHELENGSYVSVSVTVKENISYKEITNGRNNSTFNGATNYWENRDNLYAKVNGEYQKVTVSRTGRYGTYTYSLSDSNKVIGSEGGITGQPKFNEIEDGVLYLASKDETQNVYTYTYVDADGNTQTIGTSTGADTRFSTTLYQRYIDTNAGDKRIVALKSAVTTFTNSVAEKAKGADGQLGTPDDIDHRIAVVGYADTDWDYDYNTGVFIGNTLNRYEDAAAEVYSTALQDMSTTNAKNNVTASLNALQASGATRTDYGLIMAKGILDANPVPAGETRNRVVIVFTDGSPTSSNGFERDVANSAISTANAIKAGETTVYSIGIFSGADASTAGKEPDEDYYDGFLGPNYTDAEMSAACNWFMQKVSSNNGTPRTPSYYLSAGDSASLNSIFKQISDNIESGGTSTTLDSSAVIKDIISPAFALPAGATASNITLETYKCTGKSGDAYTWTKNADAMGAAATVNGDQVSVTGFDFAKNWCGTENNNGTTTYRGNKLVIKFNVSPKAGFLGGNNVYTNTSAGVYENTNAAKPVLEFNRPQVNVPIKKVTVDAADKDVYLLGKVTAAQLQEGAIVTVGNVSLDLSANNYGLEAWQNEYVDINVQIKDEGGNVISTDLSALTDDATYTLAVTVSPKTDDTGAPGTPATEKSGNGAINIKVYKPELTYKDSEVFYGDAVPTDFDTNNRTAPTKWKHDTTEADTSKMGAAPDLAITYTPEASKISDGKINSKDDIQVKATVKINDTDVTGNTTFVHKACDPACGWNETVTLNGNPAFLLHVKTATLTITKAGNVGATEGFIFNVTGPQNFKVSVQGNGSVTITGLPLGTYTVTEDTDWSWRYKDGVSISVDSVTLTDSVYTAEVTVTNTKKNDYLLDGSAYAQNNSVRPAAGN